jgi:dihydrofolate synthase / folylpolyglutamate synthase
LKTNSHSYKEVTTWLFEQFPSYQNVGAGAYKPDLHNILKLLEALGNPHEKLKFIHVAGTNGKGSTSHICSSILQEHGLKTGLFTSPHLVDFRERIKINGSYISEHEVVQWVDDVLPQLKLDYSPSFFELTFAMAIDYFAKMDCDICVIETGLGGRLDATNCITPLVSVITNIGLDHKQFLGDTRQQVAGEKAGIIKPSIPVVICERDVETEHVFITTSKYNNAPLHWVEVNAVEKLILDLHGDFQQLNAQTAIQAVRIAMDRGGWDLDKLKLQKALQSVKKNTAFQGRMEILSETPLTIIDGAHNKEGIVALLSTISNFEKNRLFIIYGASSDKDIDEIRPLFPKHASLHFTAFANARSFKVAQLMELFKDCPQDTHFYSSPKEALRQVNLLANQDDMILIFGSLFMISEFF